LAHKNPAQVERLLRGIWQPGNTYVLHYDRRAPKAEHEQIIGLKKSFPGLDVLPPRAVNWGRFSQMQTQLDMMALAWRCQPAWTHLFTISGQDFPLKRATDMERELEAKRDFSFVSWFDPIADQVWPNARERLERWYLDSALLEKLLAVPGLGRSLRVWLGWSNSFPTLPCVRLRLPTFFHWWGGANHHVLSRSAVNHLLAHESSRRIARRLSHSGHPDETFVQSALINSSFAKSIVNDDRRAILWDKGAASPRTLTVEDLPRLREAREEGKLFARKVDASVDEIVIRELEEDIGL
jgi:hypothetical protein